MVERCGAQCSKLYKTRAQCTATLDHDASIDIFVCASESERSELSKLTTRRAHHPAILLDNDDGTSERKMRTSSGAPKFSAATT